MTVTQFKQTTIKNEVTLSGVGLHTGKQVTLVFKAAPENQGHAFNVWIWKEVR